MILHFKYKHPLSKRSSCCRMDYSCLLSLHRRMLSCRSFELDDKMLSLDTQARDQWKPQARRKIERFLSLMGIKETLPRQLRTHQYHLNLPHESSDLSSAATADSNRSIPKTTKAAKNKQVHSTGPTTFMNPIIRDSSIQVIIHESKYTHCKV